MNYDLWYWRAVRRFFVVFAGTGVFGSLATLIQGGDWNWNTIWLALGSAALVTLEKISRDHSDDWGV